VFFVKTPTESPSSRPKRRDLLFLFCPSTLTAPNKSHRPPLCHPERTRISYLTALPAATYAALRKESRMTSTEATAFDRKSGGAEGSAVRPGSRTKVSVPLVPPQNRHPERSASPIDCETQCLWRGVEGPRRCLFHPCCSELFNHRSPFFNQCKLHFPPLRPPDFLSGAHPHLAFEIAIQMLLGQNESVSRPLEPGAYEGAFQQRDDKNCEFFRVKC
jgi:hypothetical protein